jgi:O-antigen/teichoic acid export membrane protein
MWGNVQQRGQLVKGFLAVGAGNYGALAVSLAINIILTLRLGVEQFGLLALLLMVSQILLLLIGNWTHVGFIRFGSQEFSKHGSIAQVFWARLSLMAPLLAMAAAVLLAAREPLSAYLGIPEWGLVLVFCHFLLTYVLNSLGAVFQARQEMSRYGAVMFFEKGASLALVALLPASWISHPLTVIGCYAASALLLSAWAVAVLGRKTFLPVDLDSSVSRALLRFSLPFVLTTWMGLFGNAWLDFVLLKWSRSVSEVGLYALASQLAGVIQQFTITFSTLLLPHFSVLVGNADEHGIKTFLDRVLPYWFFATSVLFSVALFAIAPLVPLIFGEAFAEALPALAILIVASSALSLFNAFDPLLSAYGATVALAKVFVLSVPVKVILSWLLIPQWGISGAAFSTVCGYTLWPFHDVPGSAEDRVPNHDARSVWGPCGRGLRERAVPS